MARVLIVEDETTLRASLMRGIGRMEGVEVFGAESVDEACLCLDATPPDLVISDIDLPDRTGIELLGETGRRGLSIPIVFVSAYLRAYRTQIPTHANIEVLEKPVPLDELRRLITARLRLVAREDEPFGVPDYLQLAGMGHRSVVVEAEFPDGRSGAIVVRNGDVWSARIGPDSGLDCFARIVWDTPVRVHCRSLSGDPGPRELDGTVEALLMETARRLDEERRSSGERGFVERATRYSGAPSRGVGPDLEALGADASICGESDASELERALEPDPASSESDAFSELVEAGVRALLERDLDAAYAAFSAAEACHPGNPSVRANLARLKEMGHGRGGPESGG